MSNFPIFYKLTLGIVGGFFFFPKSLPPLNAAVIPDSYQTIPGILNTTSENYIALSWSEIWDKLKRKKVAAGSRGNFNNLCLIAPSRLVDLESSENYAKKPIEIWHQNPLFIWQSEQLTKIALVENEAENFYWEKDIDTSSTHMFYDGKPLEQGQTYELIVFTPHATELYSIKLLDSNKYQQISTDLITMQLKIKSSTPEEVALAKAKYFIEKEMWQDALWELYSISNPTEELKTTLRQVKTHNFCQ